MRIVAGRVKGHRLLGPANRARPTSGRVRKSLFDMLGVWIQGRTVVDLCAGAGSLGIEALSRGAACALFVEQAPQTVRTIYKNLERCRLTGQSAVWRADAITALRHLADNRCRVDLILADPPYGTTLARDIVHAVATLPVLHEDGILAVEHPQGRPPETPGSGLAVARRRHAGGSGFTLYQTMPPENDTTWPPAVDILPTAVPPPSRRLRR